MDTAEITAQFGLKAKVLFIFRHGYKASDNHITLECLQDIMKNGVPGAAPNINVIHLGSEFVRTRETVEALVIWLLRNGVKIHERPIPSDYRLGNSEIFGLYNVETKTNMQAQGLNNYQALAQLHPDALKDWKEELEGCMEEAFDMLEEGDVCAVPCHSPTVEAVYNIFSADGQKDPNMYIKELEGIFLVEDENGNIHIIR